MALAEPVSPTQVFRFAAPCAGNACQHFDGANCKLATRIVEHLPEAVDDLPECTIRSACRWWMQEGAAACRRCPLVVTESYGALEISEPLRVAADPATPVAAPALRWARGRLSAVDALAGTGSGWTRLDQLPVSLGAGPWRCAGKPEAPEARAVSL